jgi:ribokinase
MMDANIVVIGSSNTDMVVQAPHIPRPGETVLGGQFTMAAGGKGANQAVAAARAGGTVTFIARVGDDLFGRQAIDGFKRDAINVEFVSRDRNAPSGVALIIVSAEGANSIAVAPGANGKLTPADVKAAEKVIKAADVVILQLETPLDTVAAAVEIASAAGVSVILNPAPAQPLPDDLLRRVAILTPNESEAQLLTGIEVNGREGARRAAEALITKGVRTVLITLGAEGSLIASAGNSEVVPAFRVKAVDTTAAGDVFNGSLAVALAEKKPFPDAVRFANAAAAISVTRLGAQPSAPHRNEIEDFLRERS